MQFKTLAAVSLFSLASAQNTPNVAGYESQANAYFSSLLGDSSFINQLEGLATLNPSLLNSLQALATPQTNIAALTAPPALITELPSPYNSLLLSVYSQDLAIASSNGLLSGGTPAVTGAVPTGAAASAAASASSNLGSILSSASSAAASAASHASSASAAAFSTAGAPQATGNPTVLAMGAVAGLIGGVAALL